jgi:hypothetical protein
MPARCWWWARWLQADSDVQQQVKAAVGTQEYAYWEQVDAEPLIVEDESDA